MVWCSPLGVIAHDRYLRYHFVLLNDWCWLRRASERQRPRVLPRLGLEPSRVSVPSKTIVLVNPRLDVRESSIGPLQASI
jgi:hypothetical protein